MQISKAISLTLEHDRKTNGNIHLVIPDMQIKPGVPTDMCKWIGEFIIDKRPDTIICLGDFFDFPSLSSYDRGKLAAHGRSVQQDLEAGYEAMEILLRPLRTLQEKQSQNKKRVYRPRMVFLLGNHEERLMRHVQSHPELDGFLSYEHLRLKEFGWEVYDFLQPVEIDGIWYCHYFYNTMTGKPLGGTVQNRLQKIKASFTMGHQQGLQICTETTQAGKKLWGLVAGSCYLHEEGYIGPQGNDHFRGLVLKHNVKDGDYNPCIVGLEFLEQKYNWMK